MSNINITVYWVIKPLIPTDTERFCKVGRQQLANIIVTEESCLHQNTVWWSLFTPSRGFTWPLSVTAASRSIKWRRRCPLSYSLKGQAVTRWRMWTLQTWQLVVGGGRPGSMMSHHIFCHMYRNVDVSFSPLITVPGYNVYNLLSNIFFIII